MWRFIKWTLGIVILVLLLVFIGLPLLFSSEKGRKELADALSKSLHRPVEIGGLNVGFFFSSVGLENLKIKNPEGFPEGNLISAGHLGFDVELKKIADGEIKGSVKGDGLTLHLIRKGGKTNLEGFGGASPPAPPHDPAPTPGGERKPEPTPESGSKTPDLDLSLDITDSRLKIEDLDKNEVLEIEGASLAMRLTNRKGAQDATLKIRIKSVDDKTLRVRDIEVDAKTAGDYLELEKLKALLAGQGNLEGKGRMRVKGGDDWQASLHAKQVGIDEQLMPFVSAVYPIAAKAGGQVAGNLNAEFEIKGNGLTWAEIKKALTGTGKVTLDGMALPTESVLAKVASLAGRAAGDGPITLNSAGAEFQIGGGWLSFARLSASGKEVRYDFAGKVSLDGEMKLTMDLLPLAKIFGGGAYKEASKYVKEIPIGIEGTTAAPQIKAPKAEELAKGLVGGLLEKEGGGLLDKIKDKIR